MAENNVSVGEYLIGLNRNVTNDPNLDKLDDLFIALLETLSTMRTTDRPQQREYLSNAMDELMKSRAYCLFAVNYTNDSEVVQ